MSGKRLIFAYVGRCLRSRFGEIYDPFCALDGLYELAISNLIFQCTAEQLSIDHVGISSDQKVPTKSSNNTTTFDHEMLSGLETQECHLLD